jgi:anti-sigma factor RsiW
MDAFLFDSYPILLAVHKGRSATIMIHDEGREDECLAPPALSGAQIMAAVDGEADAATLAHLRVCPGCARRVEQLRSIQRILRHRLFRLWCPPTEHLIDDCMGLLDPYQHAILSHHLQICPYCAAEYVLLTESSSIEQYERPAERPVVPQSIC